MRSRYMTKRQLRHNKKMNLLLDISQGELIFLDEDGKISSNASLSANLALYQFIHSNLARYDPIMASQLHSLVSSPTFQQAQPKPLFATPSISPGTSPSPQGPIQSTPTAPTQFPLGSDQSHPLEASSPVSQSFLAEPPSAVSTQSSCLSISPSATSQFFDLNGDSTSDDSTCDEFIFSNNSSDVDNNFCPDFDDETNLI